MRAGRAVGAAVLAVLTAACSGSSREVQPDPVFSPNPHLRQLIAAADLDPCPRSDATPPVPDGLPDLTLPCLGRGPAVHLSGLRGRPLVVNVWAAWCVPCRKEVPYFAAVHAAIGDRVRFLGVVDEDSRDNALDFAAHVTPPMTYPSVSDDDKALLLGLQQSGAIAVPSTIFVDADGVVVHRVASAYSSAAQLRADVSRYLGVAP